MLGPMLSGSEAAATRTELEKVLKSRGFVSNERLSDFLRYLIALHLEERDAELKEAVIGIEVFGRRPGYNSKDDPIVRTEARRLRARLAEYYEGTGAADPVIIELPKGAYVPFVRIVSPVPEPIATSPSRFVNWRLTAFALAGLVIVFAAVGWTRLASRDRMRYKTSIEAYDLYLRARTFEMQPAVRGIETSIDLFRQVIVKDPAFAPAYAGIAAGYAARSGFDGFDENQLANMLAQGWAAAGMALQLDPGLPDAYDALGMMQAREAQWGPAELSFRRAVELAPHDLLWRHHYVMFFLLPLGRVEQAIRQLRFAEEIDPLSLQTHSLLRLALSSAGRFDEALFHCQKAAENDQQRRGCWAANLLRQGKTDEAVRIEEEVWSGHLMEPGAQALGIAYAKAGHRENAERIAAMVPRLASKAQIYAALRNKDRTFELLNQMAPMGPARIGRDFLLSQNFAFLRGDPRLVTLRKKVGLPDLDLGDR
jgi:tetratricopeptide (TPR) repeat protein